MGFKKYFGDIIFYIILLCIISRVSSDPKHLFDLDLYENVLDPQQCESQLNYISDNSLLAAQFLDAGIRIPKGIFKGNTMDMGNYYQCLDTIEETSDMDIEGKYCIIRIPLDQELASFQGKSITSKVNQKTFEQIEQFNKMRSVVQAFDDDDSDSADNPFASLTLRVAVCIPKPCTTQQAVDQIFLVNLTALGFNYQEDFCRLPNDKQWVVADYVAIAIFSLIALLTILSTCYDICHSVLLKRDPKRANTLCQSFSVYTNCRRLLTFNSSPDALECLDGVRALALAWVVIGHTFTVPYTHTPLANPIELMEWITQFTSLWITSGPITVDTFFLLSGLLVVYTTVGKLKSMRLLRNLHFFYLHRIVRMFPLLATAVLLEASLWNHVYDGPYLQNMIARTRNCRDYWWTTLLYVQNYVNPLQMCLGHTWYLDVDMQLHILSPIVLFWVLRGRRAAWSAIGTATIAILIASTTYCFIMEFPGGTIVPSRLSEYTYYMVNYYLNTLTRGSPFFVGMIFGYLLSIYRGKTLKLSKVVVGLIWAFITVLSSWVIIYNYFLIQIDWDNQIIDSLMNSFMRPAWALSVGWMIFACVHGYGGPINWFLSLRLWKLPARISYAMYLLHYSLTHMAHSSALQPYYFTVHNNIFRFFSEYSISFVVAFFATLLIDAPFSTLFKIILGGGIKKPRPPPKDAGEIGEARNAQVDVGVINKTPLHRLNTNPNFNSENNYIYKTEL